MRYVHANYGVDQLVGLTPKRIHAQLMLAIACGDVRYAEQTILWGAEVNTIYEGTNFSALHRAVLREDYKMIRCLIKCGADVNLPTPYNDYTALHLAYERGNIEMANLLIKYGASKDALSAEGLTPEDMLVYSYCS